ncbi:MAG: hypothetical protein IKI20_06040 [Lachnospiraceae bacterium]|nr:hypothetical protein [Lachnospiraceae bacterium]
MKKWKLLIGNKGLSTVEIILILVVLVGLVLIFKDEMVKLVESVFQTITSQVSKI